MELQNEIWFEDASQNFEEACVNGDWPTAKVILADIKENGFPVFSLEKMLKEGMAREECDHGTPKNEGCEYCDEEDRQMDIGKEIAKGTL